MTRQFTFTSIAKLPDRLALLVSGSNGSSTVVYDMLELALEAGAAELGTTVRSALAGCRRLSEEEQEEASYRMANNPIADDLHEWHEKYVRVAVVAWSAGLNLRGFAAGAKSPVESHLKADVADETLGLAVMRLFDECDGLTA